MDNQLIKKIDAAFKFHPYGMPQPTVRGRWVYGPLFAIQVHDSEAMAFAHLSSIWKPQPEVDANRLNTLLALEPDCTQEITLDKDKHLSTPKCTYRAFQGTGGEYPLEVCFPLVQLAKKLGVNRWMTTPDNIGIMVFGYKDDEMIALFCARRVDAKHFEEAK